MTNISEPSPEERISKIFRAASSPVRIRILAAIGKGEACVCHLEALLNMRQAYISQQLMELRDAGLLETRRDGRYIFYRLANPALIKLLIDIGNLFDDPTVELSTLVNNDPMPHCCCPDCVSQLNPTLISEPEIPSKQ